MTGSFFDDSSFDSSVPTGFPRFDWRCRNRLVPFGTLSLLMGIVNVTPDSFSDGGQWFDPQKAVEHALQLAEDGADILDIGGESTRPGSESVTLEDELQRVIPVISALRSQTDRLISIDTQKAEVAQQALNAGADIINDVSGLTADPRMIDVCAASDCGVIVMHMQGTPQTMQLQPHYKDVVHEVRQELAVRLESCDRAGIARDRIVLDPGIGFGKTAQHNVDLLHHLKDLRSLDRPVLIGHSRKRFLSKVIGRPVEERSAGTIGVSIAVAQLGADILRVHDVRSTRDALWAWNTILNGTHLDS